MHFLSPSRRTHGPKGFASALAGANAKKVKRVGEGWDEPERFTCIEDATLSMHAPPYVHLRSETCGEDERKVVPSFPVHLFSTPPKGIGLRRCT